MLEFISQVTGFSVVNITYAKHVPSPDYSKSSNIYAKSSKIGGNSPLYPFID